MSQLCAFVLLRPSLEPKLLFGKGNCPKGSDCFLRGFALRMESHSFLDNTCEVIRNLFVACPADKQFVDPAEVAVVLVLGVRFVTDSDGVPTLEQYSADFDPDSPRFVLVDRHLGLLLSQMYRQCLELVMLGGPQRSIVAAHWRIPSSTLTGKGTSLLVPPPDG